MNYASLIHIFQIPYHLRIKLRHIIAVSEPAVLAHAPRVQMAARGHARTVRGPARDADHSLSGQRLYESWHF